MSFFASCHASRFYKGRATFSNENNEVKECGIWDLLAPVPVTLGHADGHFPHVSNLLPLEAIQISLDSRARVFKVLSG